MRTARIPCLKEPTGLIHDAGKRPDGVTLIPWEGGRCLAYDVTVSCTLAPSHVAKTFMNCGAAATWAEGVKLKYEELAQRFLFTPVAFETMGSAGNSTKNFIESLGAKIREETGDVRSTYFLLQRISIAIQRGNAISVLGSLSQTY